MSMVFMVNKKFEMLQEAEEIGDHAVGRRYYVS
jgi:hypothetical protein